MAVKFILSLGGDVTTVDANGETAVHGAAHRGSPDLIKFLAGKGAKLDMTNKMGWTPLTIAGGVYYPNLYEHYPEANAMLKKLGAKEPGTRRPIDAQPQQEGAPVKAPGKNEKGSRSAEASRSSRARAWRRASALRRHPNSASDLITV